MRKICIALSLVLSLSLFGCGNDSTEKKDNKQETTENNGKDTTENGDGANKGVAADLKDGTYEATADAWDFGQESATVTIKDGKITDIILKRLTKDGKEVNYNEWTGAEVEGKTRPNLNLFRQDMSKKMIDAQSYDVDTIATATVSTANWKVAVQRALEKAK